MRNPQQMIDIMAKVQELKLDHNEFQPSNNMKTICDQMGPEEVNRVIDMPHPHSKN